MIIRSLSASNWKKIGKVDLGPFTDGITVIHAPNKTGKSSLADAIRLTLLDYDYKTSKIESFIPWGTQEIPEVTLVFEVKGTRYRLTKKFSKGKHGKSDLCEILSHDRLKKIIDGKEATTETQKLLGMSRSSAGVAGLLWVNQGSAKLPEVDDELDKSLRPYLGTVIITGRDNRFRGRLQEKLREYLTDGVIRQKDYSENISYRKNSEPSRLVESIERLEKEKSDIESLMKEVEEKAGDAEILKSDLDRAGKDVEESDEALKRLEEADRKLSAKREDIIRQESRVETRKKEIDEHKTVLDAYQKKKDELKKTRQALETENREQKTLEVIYKESEQKYKEAVGYCKTVEKRLDDLSAKSQLLEYKRKLLNLNSDIKKTGNSLDRLEKIHEKIEGLRSELGKIQAPDRKTKSRITKLLNRKMELEAELKASQLVLTVNPESTFSVDVQIDQKKKRHVKFKKDVAFTEGVMQRVGIGIPRMGTFEVRRGEEDEDLEALSVEKKKLIEDLRVILDPLGIDHENQTAAIISELEKRIGRRKDLEEKIEEVTGELKFFDVQDTGELKEALAGHVKEKENLLKACSDLKKWKPTRESLDGDWSAFKKEEEGIKKELVEAKSSEESLKTDYEGNGAGMQESRHKIEGLKSRLDERKLKINEYEKIYGSASDLQKRIKEEEDILGKAAADLEENRLTPEEKLIPERIEEEKCALETRRGRLQEIKEELIRLEESLKRVEGSHAELTAVEQSLNAARKGFKQIDMEVKSHMMLLKIFDEIKDASIQQSLEPVTKKVDSWLRDIEGENRPELVFEDNLQAESIRLESGDYLDIDKATSYGECEQLATIVRLAYGALLAREEPQLVIFDDPLAHSDDYRHSRLLRVFENASRENLQILIFTCHPNRFDHIKGVNLIDLRKAII